jgi:hypothetical protein
MAVVKDGFFVADNEGPVRLKRAVCDDPVVAGNLVAGDEDFERFVFYYGELGLLLQCPVEMSSWGKDELENMVDRVSLGLWQAMGRFIAWCGCFMFVVYVTDMRIGARLEKIGLVAEVDRSIEEREFFEQHSGIYKEADGWVGSGVDPREVVVSQVDGRFVFNFGGGSSSQDLVSWQGFFAGVLYLYFKLIGLCVFLVNLLMGRFCVVFCYM